MVCGGAGFSPAQNWPHEKQHVIQSTYMSIAYLPAHGVAQGYSLIRSYLQNGSASAWGDYDRYNPLETGPYGRQFTGQGHSGDNTAPTRPWP